MSIIIMMDVDNNTVFNVDEVISVYPDGWFIGPGVTDNPIFKIVHSDLDFESAQMLLLPEVDIFGMIVKNRDKILYTRDLFQKELTLPKLDLLDRVVMKDPESFDQTADVVVG